jgi:hypothetical protein
MQKNLSKILAINYRSKIMKIKNSLQKTLLKMLQIRAKMHLTYKLASPAATIGTPALGSWGL